MEKTLTIREDFVKLLDGDVKASLVLSYLYDWQGIKNKTNNRQYAELLHPHKTADIYEGCFKLVGINAIAVTLKKIEKKGILKIEKNPKSQYKFDNTKWFFVDIDRIETLLSSQ